MTPEARKAKVAEITAAHSLPRRDLWPSVYEDCATLLAIVADLERETTDLRVACSTAIRSLEGALK